MTNKELFIETVEALFSHTTNSIPEGAIAYFETLKTADKEKSAFTVNGAKILIWMQEHHADCNNVFKAKDIAEGLFLPSSRSASGALRKLITDKYVTKIDGTPVCYSLTDLGMSCDVVVPEESED